MPSIRHCLLLALLIGNVPLVHAQGRGGRSADTMSTLITPARVFDGVARIIGRVEEREHRLTLLL